ncbi:hypothetical protein D1841_07760 [Neglecta sp. X4]|jgi:hypothetical protein|uniref:hypothetical protein n=1 Tax=unclassified Neglectibacter TaxID=2632164 RepID=UPI00136B7338|nr:MULTISPECIES: hypothetical protein [unclassified Neglectibacter]NBI17699.1 hypothetical protein [Neglectibacter sp. 59]NBJ73205.1 hypothetical protein [Neglectibacter sp. X4]NCE81088.1 hypothetical protein [Neglectibacter sp. X58]
MVPIKICVIDDRIDWEVLHKLVPYYQKRFSVKELEGNGGNKGTPSSSFPLRVTHGTLCTALLIESLHKKGTLEQVVISGLMMNHGYSNHSLPTLIRALQYCITEKYDIISTSLRMYHLLYARQMLPLLHQLQSSAVLVAAASNDLKLTYPAAFPCVLGVKRQVCKSNVSQKLIRLVHNPIDGIEVAAAYTETSVLKTLRDEYNLNYETSNSILVPQISAEIAYILAQNQRLLPKENILALFDAQTVEAEKFGEAADNLRTASSDNIIPILLFRYADQDYDYIMLLGKRLQNQFECGGYTCTILYDLFSQSDFEAGWYQLSKSDVNNCIPFCQRAG